MNTHTPGPWHCTDDLVIETPIEDGNGRVALVTVAKVARGGPHRVDNARLIAAAPDLLAALEQIETAWDSIPECDQVPEQLNDNSMWDEIRAAIAKAKGER